MGLAGGCHLLFPFDYTDPEPVTDVLDAGPCNADSFGKCHPGGNGMMCSEGVWKLPECDDYTGSGCGMNPHSLNKPGFCDSKWSECVQLKVGIRESCDDYCAEKNKRCCEPSKTDCSDSDLCITSRGYTYWGAESWLSPEKCANPKEMGGGQHHCDASNATWNLTGGHRCCCAPFPTSP